MKWNLIIGALILLTGCAVTEPHHIVPYREVLVDCPVKDKNMRFLEADTVDVTHTTRKCS